jgi:tetratricopeptide (TPR) repeat protein
MALPGQAMPQAGKPSGAPPPMMALPGQAMPEPGKPSGAPPLVRAPAPPRVSAGSQVPFELRKKAERIYEQALKDQAEGRIASAVMNAKLAMNFDPTVPAYRELHDQLQQSKAQPAKPKAAGGAVPRELELFEQATEAEGKGDYQRAVKLLEEACALNPKAAALCNRLGVVLSIRLKKHEEALVHLRKAIDLEPGSVVYMNNFSKVTGLLESMLDKDPKAKRGNAAGDGKVEIRKMRPVKF